MNDLNKQPFFFYSAILFLNSIWFFTKAKAVESSIIHAIWLRFVQAYSNDRIDNFELRRIVHFLESYFEKSVAGLEKHLEFVEKTDWIVYEQLFSLNKLAELEPMA